MMVPSPPPISPLSNIIAAQAVASNSQATLNVMRRGGFMGRALIVGYLLYIVGATGALIYAAVVCAQFVLR